MMKVYLVIGRLDEEAWGPSTEDSSWREAGFFSKAKAEALAARLNESYRVSQEVCYSVEALDVE